MTFQEAAKFIKNIDTEEVKKIIQIENAQVVEAMKSVFKATLEEQEECKFEFDGYRVLNPKTQKKNQSWSNGCLYYYEHNPEIPMFKLKDFKYPNDFHPYVAIKPVYVEKEDKTELRYFRLDNYYNNKYELVAPYNQIIPYWKYRLGLT